MMGNISCAAPGCKNPVIGQCRCGRFYCSEHQTNGVCFQCTNEERIRQEEVRIEREYSQLARRIRLGWNYFAYMFWAVFGGLLAMGLVGAGLTTRGVTLPPKGRALMTVLYVGAGAWLVITVLWHRAVTRARNRAADELDQTHPGFADYFQANRGQGLAVIAGIALAIVAGVVISAAENDHDREVRRLREDVDRLTYR
jgi:hypothetical protein